MTARYRQRVLRRKRRQRQHLAKIFNAAMTLTLVGYWGISLLNIASFSNWAIKARQADALRAQREPGINDSPPCDCAAWCAQVAATGPAPTPDPAWIARQQLAAIDIDNRSDETWAEPGPGCDFEIGDAWCCRRDFKGIICGRK